MTIWTILPRPTSDKNANKLRDIAFYGRIFKDNLLRKQRKFVNKNRGKVYYGTAFI